MKTCESFIYGGCDGVVPFETRRECRKARCDPCRQRPETGPCDENLKRYFFHRRRGVSPTPLLAVYLGLRACVCMLVLISNANADV